jgi:hypothetical protein
MTRVDDVAERDGWRCWLCDEPVDRSASGNEPRSPSIDTIVTKAKAKKGSSVVGEERLAHRQCNTGKGATTPAVKWPDHLFVVDPAVILSTIERLDKKGGREVMARCPNRKDGQEAATWLADRLTRLCPGLSLTTSVEPGGGQFLLILKR